MVKGYTPKSLKEALEIRDSQEVVPYAGGTDLMVEDRKDVSYLFLGKLDELKEIKEDDDFIRIGAAVTYTESLKSDLVPDLMKEAVRLIAAPAIRNAGTFGGNFGNGSAKADSVLIAFVADGKLRLVSSEGERIVNVEDFYLGRKKLDLKDNEIIAELLLPKTGWDNYYYQKVGGRRALAISRVAFAGLLEMDGEKIKRLAAAFGAVSGTVLRYKDLEEKFVGKTLEEAKEIKEEVLQAYADKMQLTEGRVSAQYRKTVCMNLMRDFLTEKGI